MATDYAEKERQFIASLEADTGQALEAWMRAISQSGRTGRNDIIDWLRENGFTFSNASWLERIHHNGGRLVYASDAPQPLSPAPPRALAGRAAGAMKRQMSDIDGVPPALPQVAQPALAAGPAIEFDGLTASNVQEVLNAAKGLRPLAMLALQKIYASVPGTTVETAGELLMLSTSKPYLALLPGAKALRFYGRFAAEPRVRVQRAEAQMKTASKAQPPFPSVLVLDDARLVDAVFVDLVQGAAAAAQV